MAWSASERWGSFADRAVRPRGKNTFHLVTGESIENRKRWDALYSTDRFIYGREPSNFLVQHIRELPRGKVLDIAMGEGRNAIFLAKKGFQVEGVDISQVALRKARRWAKEVGVRIKTINAGLSVYQIQANSYDVILNINYLQRDLVSQIRRGLKKGGVVVFENPTVDTNQNLPRNYLLGRGELKRLFSDGFEIIAYQPGLDGVAGLIARKL